jgi:phosphohistidine phosphatase SixA
MQLWLMRHAEALTAEGFGTDFDRRLSEAGRRHVAQLGRWLKERAERPELIWHSPLVRARETAELLQSALGGDIRTEVSNLVAPGMAGDRLLSTLAARTERVIVCVGHQPDIGRCLSELLGGGRFAIPPGTLAGVEFPQILVPGGGQLRWLLTPEWFG